jgi:Protein of unknown function (DUF1601)
MATANLGQGQYQVGYIELVAELMQRENSFLKQYSSQELSNSAWAVGKLVSDQRSFSLGTYLNDNNISTFDFTKQIQQSALTIIQSIATEVIERKANEFNVQSLSNTAWAFATVESKDAVLLQKATQHIIDKSLQSLHQFNSQNASNLVWAVAQLYETKSRSIDILFKGIGKRLLESSVSVKPQEISMTMWGFAKLKLVNDDMYRHVASHLNTNNASQFSAQNISNILWALATAGMSVHFDAVSNIDSSLSNPRKHEAGLIDPVLQCCTIAAWEFMMRPHEFNPQDIANLCWSSATLGVKDVQFLKMAEEEVKCRINKFQKGGSEAMTAFNGQDIENILWQVHYCCLLDHTIVAFLIIWLLNVFLCFFFLFSFCYTGPLQPYTMLTAHC